MRPLKVAGPIGSCLLCLMGNPGLRIDKTSSDSKFRLCKVKEETIDHLVSSCSKIAQTDYKERHDKVASILHWNLCRKYNLPTADKWWKHKVDKVLQKKDVKIILWDFKI